MAAWCEKSSRKSTAALRVIIRGLGIKLLDNETAHCPVPIDAVRSAECTTKSRLSLYRILVALPLRSTDSDCVDCKLTMGIPIDSIHRGHGIHNEAKNEQNRPQTTEDKRHQTRSKSHQAQGHHNQRRSNRTDKSKLREEA